MLWRESRHKHSDHRLLLNLVQLSLETWNFGLARPAAQNAKETAEAEIHAGCKCKALLT